MNYEIPFAVLERFCTDLLAGCGVPADEAAVVAGVVVDTSLDGIDTHGISRMPVYLECLKSGRIKARPAVKITRTSPACAVLDGDNGLGHLLTVRAMETALEIARQAGVGVVSVRHSNHFGAGTYYCKMAAACGMIGLVFTNSPPGIPPWGGRKPYFGTNPVSFGFPTADDPVVVDMSSSKVARGNIILAAREGRSIPEGWAIDADGNPTVDAQKALEGAVMPMGGPKGSALALAVEILAGVVSGAAYGPHVGWIYDDSVEPSNVGHFVVAIDIESLLPGQEYALRMEQMKAEIRSVPLAQGFNRILLPGERKKMVLEQRLKQGIPVPAAVLAELNEIADFIGIKRLPAVDGWVEEGKTG